MLPTRDHAVIRRWAARKDAVPATIPPLTFDSEPAVLTFLVGRHVGTAEIHPISWESFFAQFDLLGLSFAFDDRSSRFTLVRVEKNSQPHMEQ